MEIKVGEKYLWKYGLDVEEVEVMVGVDPDDCCCVRDLKGVLWVALVSDLSPLRTSEEVEREKEFNRLCSALRERGGVAEYAIAWTANFILENYIRKDNPRVVEPLNFNEFRSVCITASYAELFDWMKANKHICVKED